MTVWLSRRWATVAAATASAVAFAAPAIADTAPAPTPGWSATTQMSAHAIRSAVLSGETALATLNDGKVVSISRGTYEAWNKIKDQPKAQQTLPGNCGSSTITFVPVGNRQGKMATSFVTNAPAASFDWNVSFVDNFGASHQRYGDAFYFSSSWASPVFTFTGGGGPTRAHVETPDSSALLVTGVLCSSLGPTESAIIY